MESNLTTLTLGLDDTVLNLLAGELSKTKVIPGTYNLEYILEHTLDPAPSIIICGIPPTGDSLTEVAQTLRMLYPECSIIYVTNVRQGFDSKIFKKNGFTETFLLPGDLYTLKQFLEMEITKASGGTIKSYRQVKLVDITPDMKLDFDVHLFLPSNNKYLRYAAAGSKLDSDRAERLVKNHVGSVHVTTDQMSDFYKFTARQLKELGQSETLSETEKKEKREQAVRSLMSGMFTDVQSEANDSISRGRQIIDDCKEIVKAYVIDSENSRVASWFDKLQSLAGSRSSAYSHASNVSTYASLFSMALGIGNPEDMALAGLLHDTGLVDIPVEIQMKAPALWTPEEKATYENHSQRSLDIIRDRKIIINDAVQKIILQHHETYDGRGYPKNIPGPKIFPPAQVLAIADYFDDLTALVDGKPLMTPVQALAKIVEESLGNLSQSKFDPQIVSKLKSIFMGAESSFAA